MATKKTIALLEATSERMKHLSRSLASGPNRLLLFGQDTGQLTALSEELQASFPTAEIACSGCPMDASWEADALIINLPNGIEKEIAQKIKPFATQKLVIHLSDNPSALENLLPHSRIRHLDASATDLEAQVEELLQNII